MIALSETLKRICQKMVSGQREQAEDLCHQVLAIKAENPDALHFLGLIYHQCGKSNLAVDLIANAIEIKPNSPEYHYNIGVILTAIERTEDAIGAYQDSLSLRPDHAEALNNLGLLLYDLNRVEEAIILFQQAIRNKPDITNAYYNLGKALQAQGKPKAAIDAYDHVLKMLPDSAETRFNRSLSLLLTRDFEEGWDQYEWRFNKAEPKSKSGAASGFVRWNGGSFAGKRLLVLDEQGIGDTLQFIRYLSMLKKWGGSVIFETSKPLKSLLEKFPGIDELVEPSPVGMSEIESDFYVPLMSLPGIFKTTLETIPDRVPYIFPSNKKIKLWQDRINKHTFNIGIVWAGNPTAKYEHAGLSGLEHVNLAWAGNPSHKIADSRSNRLKFFKPLAEIEGVQLYGLQKGAAAGQAEELSNSINVINLGEEFEDFFDTAGVIENLDLIISVETSVAHLVGPRENPFGF